jgi:predicted ArsR family transcriptional regulator
MALPETTPVLPTRLRILEYLRRNHTTTAPELGHALAMTAANVRYHLAMLVTNDLLEVVGRRREGRGRPERVYGLSRRVLGDGLDALSSALLDEYLSGRDEEGQAQSMRLVARRLAGGLPADQVVPLPKRLAAAIERLNELHYLSRWEAGPSGPRLILGHCPYRAIIADHPELCRLDGLLLEEWLGLPAVQQAKLECTTRGETYCIFQVYPR